MAGVRVVPVVEPAIGIAPPLHYLVTEPSGRAIVIEFLKGEMVIFEAPLGVLTNAPSYDWHETNLRNYINLSPVALPGKTIGELNFKPLGGGSGMIGLPGDNTPSSRFVRAVAATQTARATPTGEETVYELFRILDNFNLPRGAAEGSGEERTSGMRSSTIWTTGYDTIPPHGLACCRFSVASRHLLMRCSRDRMPVNSRPSANGSTIRSTI